MNETSAPKTGRTYADALVEIFSTWKLLFIVVTLLVVVFFVVHNSAEPGTSVEFLGVIKYQKAKAAPTPTPPAAIDESASYRLPVDAPLNMYGTVAIPILDGTLAIKPDGPNSLRLVGDSISNVRIGVRNADGTPTNSVYRMDDGTMAFHTNTHLEILYRGKHFSAEVIETERNKTSQVTVRPIARAALKLKSISEISSAGGGE